MSTCLLPVRKNVNIDSARTGVGIGIYGRLGESSLMSVLHGVRDDLSLSCQTQGEMRGNHSDRPELWSFSFLDCEDIGGAMWQRSFC